MPVAPTYIPVSKDELVFGLVYGAGTEIEPVERLLRECLLSCGYDLVPVHLSKHFATILGVENFDSEAPDATRQLQGMGDDLRKRTKVNHVLALLSAYLIAATRVRDTPQPRTAWLVRSFKRPEEVREMRRIYGPRFILLGVHVPEGMRRLTAARGWQRRAEWTTRRYEEEATTDLRRDEDDSAVTYGQKLRSTFAEADFFVDARSDAQLEETLTRVARLLFAEPFESPMREEQAMFHAFTAGLRSAEMSRQVGAAIISPQGDLVSVGTNEVPSGRGGLYWSPDEPNGRDFARKPSLDSNTFWQRRVAGELILRMEAEGWLADGKVHDYGGERFISDERLDTFLDAVANTRFADITEFGRAVHAEMDALTTAARFGRSVQGCTAVVTTTPCHGCARHLIASGIVRVIAMKPYLKGLARELHEDAIEFEPETPGVVEGKVVFEQYIGVAPRCYPQYFDFGQAQRRNRRGEPHPQPKQRSKATARVLQSGGSFAFGGPALPSSRVSELEKQAARRFEALVGEHGLHTPTPS